MRTLWRLVTTPIIAGVEFYRWLTDPDLRDRLRSAARARRAHLTGWTRTADEVGAVLSRVAQPGPLAR